MTRLTPEQCQIAQLQELCSRTLTILDEEKFWDNTNRADGWYSSLHRDLTKASKGKEFTFFLELMKHIPKDK